MSITPYQDSWPRLSESEKLALLQAFAGKVVEIEHIGSTSVPGLAAKPLIDMMAAIETLADYRQYIQPLQKLGYEFMPERVFDDRVFFPNGPYSNRTHHLNLMLKNTQQWTDSLMFSDCLRTQPETRQAYQKLKVSLANQHAHDRVMYPAMKSEFITSVLVSSRELSLTPLPRNIPVAALSRVSG